MKIMVASDVHGSGAACKKLIANFHKEKADVLLLLGDLYYHGPRNPLPEEYAPMKVCEMLTEIKENLIAVKGNCDGDVDQMISAFPIEKNAQILLGTRRVYATHGDVYSAENLPPLPKGSVVLFGHTHVAGIWQKDGITAVNPGSCSLPKNDTVAGFVLLTENEVTFKTLNGDTYKSVSLC